MNMLMAFRPVRGADTTRSRPLETALPRSRARESTHSAPSEVKDQSRLTPSAGTECPPYRHLPIGNLGGARSPLRAGGIALDKARRNQGARSGERGAGGGENKAWHAVPPPYLRSPVRNRGRAHGFTRADLLACVAVLVLLIALALPGLATLRRDSSHAVCVNNLRQIGRAFHVWGQDYNGRLPFRVMNTEGGLRGHPLLGNLWFDFAWISNHLASPRVLACPADVQKKAAPDWGAFLSPAFRNAGVSYFLQMDAGYALGFVVGPEAAPMHLVSGDRNIVPDGRASCSVGLQDVAALRSRPVTSPFWTNQVHGLWGNLLLFDGQVRTAGYHTATNLAAQGDDNGVLHLLIP